MFSRIIHVDSVVAHEGRLEASPAECAAVASVCKLEKLANFTFEYRLRPLSGGRFVLSGTLRADVTQLCVATLEPVDDRIREDVSVEFWPEHQIEADDMREPTIGDEIATVLAVDPPEPIVGGRIDLGAFAAEILSAAINPYPRKPDTEFVWQDPKAPDPATSGPFAALAKLRGGSAG